MRQIAVGTTGSKSTTKPLLICFSHLRWDFVFQRPQHILTRAAKSYRVLFIEEPVFGREMRASWQISERDGDVTIAAPHLPSGLTSSETSFLQRSLLSRLLANEGQPPRIAWYYSPMAMAFTPHFQAEVTVYDCMDELSAFRGAPPELTEYERQLFAKADLVFTGGQSLYEAKSGKHPNLHAFPSSIDTAHFEAARSSARRDPADQADIPHPRLGFFGVIDERMDLELLAAVAALRPQWQFVMIGPTAKIDPSSLPRASNIHWLGGKSYSELPTYVGGWDVGFMPFAHNESTRFISPTKTPEFLASGIPVVSTSITDVVRPYGEAGLVEIADTAPDVVAKVELAMERERAPWLDRVDRHLANTSWDKTWRSMQTLVERSSQSKTSAGSASAPVTFRNKGIARV